MKNRHYQIEFATYLTSSYLCLQPWAPKSLGINSGGLINSRGFYSHLIVSNGLRNVKIWTPKFFGIIPGGFINQKRRLIFNRWEALIGSERLSEAQTASERGSRRLPESLSDSL